MQKISIVRLLQKSQTAFTLIELIVSITILSVIMLSVFLIYSDLIQVNRRLEGMRIVQENIRNITEQIASDIREKGIDFSYYDGSLGHENAYTGSGNNILAIRGGDTYYSMKNNLTSGTSSCSELDQKNPMIHCFIGKVSPTTTKVLSDDRVSIDTLRFFISGNPKSSVTNLSQEGKVTLILSLGISNTAGVNSEIAKVSHMLIETTISEKIYKQD